jgi:hypothetical protein
MADIIPLLGIGEQIIITLVGVIATAIVSLILFFLKRYISARDECFKTMQDEMKIISERTLRQSKAQVLAARIQDDITNRLHPGEKSNSADKIIAELQDQKGEY